MNIKEHIEAGHYPKDEKGRALVPLSDNRTATIFATDAPEAFCIVGKFENWHMPACWDERGGRRDAEKGGPRLLPPPPCKVRPSRWLVIARDKQEHIICRRDRDECVGWLDALGCPWSNAYELVELTGEYEEPWS